MLAVGRQYPHAWSDIDHMRSELRGRDAPDWPDWCYIPIAGGQSAVATALHVDVMRLHITHPDRIADGAILAALAAWRMTQGVYRVDPGLYPALVTTALDADMPADVLYRLPEWCIYVETPDLALDGAPVPGAYVHLEHDVHTGRAELRMLLDGDGPLVPVAIHIGPWTLAEAISRSLHVSAARASAVGARTIGGLAELLLPVVEPVVNVVLYIATQAGEITGPGTPGNPTPVRTRRHGLRLFPANGMRAWDVGVRIGAALRAAYHAAETSSDPAARHRPRPHVRRAHWHTFLSGPRAEARRRDVRWMPPIPVNVQSADDMPATVRRVR